jgi:hypothetical protein
LKAFEDCKEFGHGVMGEDSSLLSLDLELSQVLAQKIWERQKDRGVVADGGELGEGEATGRTRAAQDASADRLLVFLAGHIKPGGEVLPLE